VYGKSDITVAAKEFRSEGNQNLKRLANQANILANDTAVLLLQDMFDDEYSQRFGSQYVNKYSGEYLGRYIHSDLSSNLHIQSAISEAQLDRDISHPFDLLLTAGMIQGASAAIANVVNNAYGFYPEHVDMSHSSPDELFEGEHMLASQKLEALLKVDGVLDRLTDMGYSAVSERFEDYKDDERKKVQNIRKNILASAVFIQMLGEDERNMILNMTPKEYIKRANSSDLPGQIEKREAEAKALKEEKIDTFTNFDKLSKANIMLVMLDERIVNDEETAMQMLNNIVGELDHEVDIEDVLQHLENSELEEETYIDHAAAIQYGISEKARLVSVPEIYSRIPDELSSNPLVFFKELSGLQKKNVVTNLVSARQFEDSTSASNYLTANGIQMTNELYMLPGVLEKVMIQHIESEKLRLDDNTQPLTVKEIASHKAASSKVREYDRKFKYALQLYRSAGDIEKCHQIIEMYNTEDVFIPHNRYFQLVELDINLEDVSEDSEKLRNDLESPDSKVLHVLKSIKEHDIVFDDDIFKDKESFIKAEEIIQAELFNKLKKIYKTTIELEMEMNMDILKEAVKVLLNLTEIDLDEIDLNIYFEQTTFMDDSK